MLEPHGLTHRAGGKRPLFLDAGEGIEEKKIFTFLFVFFLLLYSIG